MHVFPTNIHKQCFIEMKVLTVPDTYSLKAKLINRDKLGARKREGEGERGREQG